MISTLSKQGGRRYPQMGSTGLAFHGWLPSIGGTVTPPVPPAPATNTPGFLGRVRNLDERRRYETEEEKLERRIREGTIQAPVEPAPEPAEAVYSREAIKLSAAIAKFRADARASEEAIARLEKAQDTARARKALLHAQQALVLARAQEAAMLEEMEVMDVAFVANLAVRMTLQ